MDCQRVRSPAGASSRDPGRRRFERGGQEQSAAASPLSIAPEDGGRRRPSGWARRQRPHDHTISTQVAADAITAVAACVSQASHAGAV